MIRYFVITVALVSFLLMTGAPVHADNLPRPVIAALKNHNLDGSGISIFVQAVDANEPLLVFNEHVPRSPASIIKVLISYAALDLLGPAYRWHTEVWVTGPIRDGRLEGDLVLRGGGDPGLTSERFWTLLREIQARGITHIAGDLVIDDTLFAPNRERPGDMDGQPYRAYNVLPNAMLVNFNVTEFRLRHQGRGTAVQLEPPLYGFRLDNQVTSRDGDCTGFQRGVAFDLPEGFAGKRALLSGRFPTGCREFTLWRAVLEAPDYANALFRSLWQQLGGTIEGELRIAPRPQGARRIIAFPSRSLAENVREINKWSNNVMTRHLFLTLAAEKRERPATVEQAREVVAEWLEGRGIPAPGLFIDNGSGLSRRTRITADTFGRMLVDAWHHPYMPDLVASMPISAVDGTLRNRLGGDSKGRMHLKTGRINDVSAIAGIVTSKAGRRHAVVIMVNGPTATSGAGESVQDAVLRWVHNR